MWTGVLGVSKRKIILKALDMSQETGINVSDTKLDAHDTRTCTTEQ